MVFVTLFLRSFSKFTCRPVTDDIHKTDFGWNSFSSPGVAGSNLTAFKVKISRFQRFKMLNINANAGHTPDCNFLSSFFRHLLKLILVDGFGIGKFIQRKQRGSDLSSLESL